MEVKLNKLPFPAPKFSKTLILLMMSTIFLQSCTIIEERLLKQIVTDAEIKLDINKRLFSGKNHDLFFSLHTNVYEGRVMLTGTVGSEYQRQRIIALTSGIPGIRKIYNNVQVTKSGKFKNTANDVWISTKFNSQLLAEKGVKSANYQTRVLNSTIYLIGRALSQKELNKVLTIAKRIKHVNGVVHHVLVKPVKVN
tara:strand:- start:6 stop:593 length:588 start_codon:yes stop_codon:yes gene_type:complete